MIIINHQMKSRNGENAFVPYKMINHNEMHNYRNHGKTATQPNRAKSAFGGG